MTVDPTGVTLYVNGVASKHAIALTAADINSFKIGSYQGWGSRNFRGRMDEVCLWNRTLTQEEIRSGRHLVKDPEADPTIIAYFKFNDDSGVAWEEVDMNNAITNGNAEMLNSTAPVGLGTSDLISLNGLGTYDFPNAQAKLIFDEGTAPDGEMVVSHIFNPSAILPGFDQSLIPGYYILNEYPEANSSTPLPQEIHFQSTGVMSNFMSANSNLSTYTRDPNQGPDAWSNINITAFDFVAGLAGQVQITDASPITSYGQIAIGRSKFADVAGQVTIKTNNATSSLVEGGGSAELSLIATNQVFSLPTFTDDEIQSIASPKPGSLAYDSSMKSLVFYDGSSWRKIIAKVSFDEIKGAAPDPEGGVSSSSLSNVWSVLNLSNSSGVVILPGYSSADLVNINTPSDRMMIYNVDEGRIQIYRNSLWTNIASEALGYNVGSGSGNEIEGIGIGMDEVHPTAALEISSGNFRTLLFPLGDHREQNQAPEGSVLFSVVHNSFMLFDGEAWKKLYIE